MKWYNTTSIIEYFNLHIYFEKLYVNYILYHLL